MSTTHDAPTPMVRKLISRGHVHAAGFAGLVVLAGVGYAAAVAPLLHDRREAQSHQQMVAWAQAESENAARELHAIRDRLLALGASGEPTPVGGERLRDVLLGHSRESGVSLGEIAIGTPEPMGTLVRTRAEAHGTGLFSDIVGLIERIRRDMPGVAIDGLTIMRGDDGQPSLSVHLSLSSYTAQPSPAEAPSEPSGTSAASSADPDR